jgi:heptaprenyl diphosphate synthase
MQAFLDAADSDLSSSVRNGLDRVEDALHKAVATDVEFIAEPVRHSLAAGGKRFRPLLTLLAAHFGDPAAFGVVEAAVVVELTHLATLYHDDVMDESPVRRGAATANARWGNTVAILTGDYLFSRASDIISDLGPEAVRIESRTFSRLVTGQIRETRGAVPGEDPVAHYLRVLDEKTASLIATSARFGAMFSGASEQVVEAVQQYGEIVGVAFQLSDDVLDIASQATESGKTPGTDLREGISTLPALYALRSPDTDPRLRELLSGPLTDDARHGEALELLRSSAALVEARETTARYASRARDVLADLPAVPARDGLAALADFVLARTG